MNATDSRKEMFHRPVYFLSMTQTWRVFVVLRWMFALSTLLVPQVSKSENAKTNVAYGFYPELMSQKENKVDLVKHLPFVLQVEGDHAYFLLIRDRKGGGPLEADFDEIEVSNTDNHTVRRIRTGYRPIEWHLEPKFITNTTAKVNVAFDLIQESLWKQCGEGVHICKVVLPVWKMNTSGDEFVLFQKIVSSPFEVRLHNGKIVGVFDTPGTFQVSGDQRIKCYSQLNNSPGVFFKQWAFRP